MKNLPQLLLIIFCPFLNLQGNESYDIIVYGGTSAGIVAGIQAKKMGKSVVIIEPTDREGGLTTGGLGQTDIGNKMVIGGLSREFYQRVAKHYSLDNSWKWQKRQEYRDGGQTKTDKGESSMWTFEPSAALKVFRDWISETNLKLIFNERLNRKNGVIKLGNKIVQITMESGRTFAGKMFIDATYEGDLLAAAGVSYTVGREANSKYGETLNGVQTKMAKHHNFVDRVDPYRVKGDPSSGLLPFIDENGPGKEGGGDHKVQGYCFRMCLTDHPDNRIPFKKPSGYNEMWFELLLRNYEAGETRVPWINSSMPNRKTDTNNRQGFSSDFIGQNYDYPEADYAKREKIVAQHLLYHQGLMWTLANHPRMPRKIREEVSRWGLCKDEFIDGNGWQNQLYIREARRMVSDLVMTQNHCQKKEVVFDSVGMGAYNMDSHHVQRYITDEGYVKNEGDVQVAVPPYPIGYRSIVPREKEANNLLVPVCLSASHIAFGSIRMEPVFMVLAQSAVTAASMAIDDSLSVQQVSYQKLSKRLKLDGQVLQYKPTLAIGELKGIIVDDKDAQLIGEWKEGSVIWGINEGYVHDQRLMDGSASATFVTTLPENGRYEVQVSYKEHYTRASNIEVEISHEQGVSKRLLNQREKPKIDRFFQSLGTFKFNKKAKLFLSNKGVNGSVAVDAVRWLPVDR